MSPRQRYSNDRASLQGRFDPWLDDQTTTTYESMHLRSMRQGKPIRRASGPEPALMGDFALPEILEEEYLEPQYPARSATRSAAYPVQQVRAAARPALNTRTQVPARPPLRALPPVVSYDEEENPFARRSNVGAWFLATAATAGLFGAVLFGRVLIEAGTAVGVQPSAPLTAATTPSIEAAAVTRGETTSVASPVPSVEAPAMPSLAPFAAQGASARDTAAQPSSTSKVRSRGRQARHERRRVTTSDDAAETLQRAEAKSRPAKTKSSSADKRESEPARQTKSSSSASSLAEERESTSANGIPALLRINSRPWSQIFIDGKLIGNTPQLAIQLTAGTHSVRLVNAEFGMSKTFTLKLAAGERITRVETLQE